MLTRSLFAALGLALLSSTAALPTSSESWLEARSRGPRRRQCFVKSFGRADKDDVPQIERAFAECGAGGVIVFPQGTTYHINSLLTMKGCNNCEVQWDGMFVQSDDIKTIQAGQYLIQFQTQATNILFRDATNALVHSPAGTGGIDGQGLKWWIANANQSGLDAGALRRPILIVWENCHNLIVDGLRLINSPNWNSLLSNSSSSQLNNMIVSAISSNSSVLPKNTDGLDTYNVTDISITNLDYTGGDDCISLKSNNERVTISGITCRGSHGVSIGSLGQYPGIRDVVKTIRVSNVDFTGGSNAFRIKIWPAGPTTGSAEVSDVVYDGVSVNGTDLPIAIDSCYNSKSTADCLKYQSTSTSSVTDIHVGNVHGTTSGAKKGTVASMVCPPNANCSIYLTDIAVTPPSGYSPVYLCQGLANLPGVPGVPCTAAPTS